VKSNNQILKLEMIEINRQMDRGKGNWERRTGNLRNVENVLCPKYYCMTKQKIIEFTLEKSCLSNNIVFKINIFLHKGDSILSGTILHQFILIPSSEKMY
jgi:hypothetical protein